MAVVVLATALGRQRLLPGAPDPSGDRTAAATAATVDPAPTTALTCREPGTLDLDGDGCPDPLHVDGTTIRALGRTFQVGRPGDQVQVADWDCDGRATAGVVRPDTGEIFLFDGWEVGDGSITVAAVDVVAGARTLRPGTGPACVPVAEGPGGLAAPLDLRREGS